MAKRVEIPLTDTLIKSLPSITEFLAAFRALETSMDKISRDLNRAERAGAVQMARAFVALYLVNTQFELVFKKFSAIFAAMKETRVPSVLELEGVTNVPLDEGYRVQTADTMWVTVKEGMREAAMAWVREHQPSGKDGASLADIIVETIHAGTLSAAGRYMLAEDGLDLPPDLFTSYFKPTTSVNKIANRK